MNKIRGMILGLAAMALPQGVLAQALQPGEIELHIEALGQVPPDRAEIEFNLRGRGVTKAEADKQLADRLAELQSQLKQLGIRPDQIKYAASRTDQRFLDTVETVVEVAAPPPSVVVPAAATGSAIERPAPPKPRPNVWSNGTLTVTLVDMPLAVRVLALRGDDGGWSAARNPRFSTSDPAAAERTAIAQAFAQARIQADAYAAAMGYKVVRVLRVSNAKPPLNLPDTIRTIATFDVPSGRNQAALQATVASVAIDYAVAPK